MCFSVSKLTILVDQSNYLLIAKTVYLKLRKMFVTVTNCTFCSYKQFFSEMEEILSYGYNKNGRQNQIDTSSKWHNFHNHTFICRVCIIIYCFIDLKLFIWFPSLFEYCAAHGRVPGSWILADSSPFDKILFVFSDASLLFV